MNPTSFSQIIGNEAIKLQLSRMVAKRVVGHALLFAGPEGVGKSLFALALAAHMMKEYDPENDHSAKIAAGQHPDIHIYRPEGKLGLHTIESLRQLGSEVHYPPFEASWKVFIIHEADRMLSYSANALLKTFEEPPSRTLIILLSRSRTSLLPTILSRCRTLHFQSIPIHLIQRFIAEKYNLDEATSFKIARESGGSLEKAVNLAEQGDALRHSLLNIFAKGPLSNYRLLQESVQAVSGHVEAAKKLAEDRAKEELLRHYNNQMSSHQQSAIEKEVEGLTALALAYEAKSIFESILSWYRDMQLILMGGSHFLLANPDYTDALQQAVQRGESKSLVQVYEAVERAYLALQRSTPLPLCLENLLLKLDRVDSFHGIEAIK